MGSPLAAPSQLPIRRDDRTPGPAPVRAAPLHTGTLGIVQADLPRGVLQTWQTETLRLEHYAALPTSAFAYPALAARPLEITRLVDLDTPLTAIGHYGVIHPKFIEIAAFILGQPPSTLDYYTARLDAPYRPLGTPQRYTAAGLFLETGLCRSASHEWDVCERRRQGPQAGKAGDRYSLVFSPCAIEPPAGDLHERNGKVKKVQGPPVE